MSKYLLAGFVFLFLSDSHATAQCNTTADCLNSPDCFSNNGDASCVAQGPNCHCVRDTDTQGCKCQNSIPIIKDDGSGFNPDTLEPNFWVNDGGWTIGTTVQDVVNDPQFPDLAASQAAQDLIAQLGATNQVLAIARTQPGDSTSMISIAPFLVTTTAGRTFNFDFEQLATNLGPQSPGNGVAIHMIDSVEVQLNDNGPELGADVWLWVHMHWLVKRHIPAVIKITHNDCKGPRLPDGTRGPPWFNTRTEEVTPAMDVWELVSVWAHFHAFFPDDDRNTPDEGMGDLDSNDDGIVDGGDTIGITSEGAVEFIPTTPTVSAWGMVVLTLLILTAGSLVIGRRRRAVAA